MEDGPKSVHFAAEEWTHGFGRHIAGRKSGPAGADDQIHVRIGGPAFNGCLDGGNVVRHDRPCRKMVACGDKALREKTTGTIRLLGPRIGRGQHGYSQRIEIQCLVHTWQLTSPVLSIPSGKVDIILRTRLNPMRPRRAMFSLPERRACLQLIHQIVCCVEGCTPMDSGRRNEHDWFGLPSVPDRGQGRHADGVRPRPMRGTGR